jgi:transaldolase
MTESMLKQTKALGQSIWLDQIRRSWLTRGMLAQLVENGLGGVTSNPSIFKKAIADSPDYQEDLRRLVLEGKPAEKIYETLIVDDIQHTADELKKVYEQNLGEDGYVSLEVNPHFAHDTQKTMDEARHYWKLVDRANLLIKIPATAEGLPAIQAMISEGININVTLMFSISQYDLVAEAFISGLEKRLAQGNDIDGLFSVASFFVSRIDQKVDPLLQDLNNKEAKEIQGKVGIANAKMAYQRFKETFRGPRWEALASRGAKVQRVLYGSTSTKNPAYPDTMYVDCLIGEKTINTIPLKTIEAYQDHGTASSSLERGLDEAVRQLETLSNLGIDLDNITRQLLVEGVQKFNEPYDALIDFIVDKQTELLTA